MAVLAFAVFAVASAALAAIDARTRRLPDALVLPAAAIALVLLLLAAICRDDPARLAGALLGAGLLLAPALVVHAARPAAWGGGDVKLAGLVGLHLGWRGMDAVALGAAAGALLSGAAGAGALSVRRGGEIPLGPPLLAGCWWGLAATL